MRQDRRTEAIGPGRIPKRQSSDVDAQLGARLRQRRTILGLTQHELADACGLAHQQLQKYETGENRISVSRLLQISMLLETPIEWFLDGLKTSSIGRVAAKSRRATEREALMLLRIFNGIADQAQRQKIIGLARILAIADPEHLAPRQEQTRLRLRRR